MQSFVFVWQISGILLISPFKRNTMITIEQLKETEERKLALRRYL